LHLAEKFGNNIARCRAMTCGSRRWPTWPASHLRLEQLPAAALPEDLAMSSQPDRMLRPAEVATLLNVSDRTLSRFAAKSDFPRPIRVGKHRRYSLAAVEAWIARTANGGAR
jgi:excisionase family DNA binding protein